MYAKGSLHSGLSEYQCPNNIYGFITTLKKNYPNKNV